MCNAAEKWNCQHRYKYMFVSDGSIDCRFRVEKLCKSSSYRLLGLHIATYVTQVVLVVPYKESGDDLSCTGPNRVADGLATSMDT